MPSRAASRLPEPSDDPCDPMQPRCDGSPPASARPGRCAHDRRGESRADSSGTSPEILRRHLDEVHAVPIAELVQEGHLLAEEQCSAGWDLEVLRHRVSVHGGAGEAGQVTVQLAGKRSCVVSPAPHSLTLVIPVLALQTAGTPSPECETGTSCPYAHRTSRYPWCGDAQVAKDGRVYGQVRIDNGDGIVPATPSAPSSWLVAQWSCTRGCRPRPTSAVWRDASPPVPENPAGRRRNRSSELAPCPGAESGAYSGDCTCT